MSEFDTPIFDRSKKGLKTAKAYVVGFVLSLILTLASFYLAGTAHFSSHAITASLMILAIIQLFVQVVCFLRLNTSAEGRWYLMPFLCAIFILLVIVSGSIWIMWNLNANMMVPM